MTETTNLSIRIDRNLKNEADRIFNALGMNLSTAINVFVRQSVRQKKIPFEISLLADEDQNTIRNEAIAATRQIWQNSIQNGTNEIPQVDINAEIAAARAARKTHKAVL